MVIPFVICTLGSVANGLVQRLEDSEIREIVETIKTTTWLRSGRILRRVLRLEETCCPSDFSKKKKHQVSLERENLK